MEDDTSCAVLPWSASGLLGALLSVLPAVSASAEYVYERLADGTIEVQGHGWGHGRGMSQRGAQGQALQGYPGMQRTVPAPSSIRVRAVSQSRH